MTFTEIALSLFFTLNSIGNLPLIIAILAQYEPKRQMQIIFREMVIGLFILLVFGFFGVNALNFLNIDQAVMGIAGGIILFMLALNMMFPKPKTTDLPQHEPFIVPIAIPIVVGPGTLAMVAVFSHQTPNKTVVLGAAVTAWFFTTAILLSSSFIRKIIPSNVLTAVERLMGMILTLIAVEMFTGGLIRYVK